MNTLINSAEKFVPTVHGDTFVELGVEYVLSKDFTVVAYHGADREYFRLRAGQKIKKIKAGNACSPSVWEVT